MANTARNIGLTPYQTLIRATFYEVASGYATAIFVGDPVVLTGTGNQVNVITAGTGNKCIGAVIGCFDTNGLPLSYIPASTGGKVLVADAPEQRFVAQDDNHGSGSAFGINGCGGNVNMVAGSGSTVTGRSGWKLNSQNTPGTTAGDQIRLIKPVPASDNDYTAKSAQWIVLINNHTALQGIVGVGV